MIESHNDIIQRMYGNQVGIVVATSSSVDFGHIVTVFVNGTTLGWIHADELLLVSDFNTR
jgi:hypothetical protein